MPTTRPGYIYGGPTDGWVSIGQEAAVNPIYYQATEPTGASTGSIWIDEDDDVPSVDSSLFYRWKKTAVGGETTLSGNDDASLPLKYTVGYEELYLNGVLLVRGSDYTASTGTTITGLTALVAGDVVTIMSQVAWTVADTYSQTTADAKFNPIGVGYTVFGSGAATGSNSSTTIADFSGGTVITSITKRNASTKLLIEAVIHFSPQYANNDNHTMYAQIAGVDYELLTFSSGPQYNLTQRTGILAVSGLNAGTYSVKIRYKVNGAQDLYTLAGRQNFIKVTEVA